MFGGHRFSRQVGAEIEHGVRDFERGPDPRLISFLSHNRGDRPYAAAVDGSMAAAGYLAKGLPVLPMGGFTSDAPAPTVGGLADLVREGRLRYVVLTGLRMGKSGAEAVARDGWVAGIAGAFRAFRAARKYSTARSDAGYDHCQHVDGDE